MHGCDIHEAFYLNYKIHDPWVRCLGPWVGPLWSQSVNVHNFIFPEGWFYYCIILYHIIICLVLLFCPSLILKFSEWIFVVGWGGVGNVN